jgi:hypothetical protein
MTSTAFRPNLFVLGAMKAGTTTVYRQLEQWPGVCVSRPKEPCFFERDYEEGLDYYQRTYFAHWQGEPWICDCRTSHLYLPYVPALIQETNPQARLIAILRNPIERAYSEWKQWYAAGREQLDFAEAVADNYTSLKNGRRLDSPEGIRMHYRSLGFEQDSTHAVEFYRAYLDIGHYDEQCRWYLDRFPRAQVLFLKFDDLANNGNDVMRCIGRFLEQDADSVLPQTVQQENRGETRLYRRLCRTYECSGLRHVLPVSLRTRAKRLALWAGRDRGMPETTRSLLREYYRPRIEALEALLGWDLGHWQ